MWKGPRASTYITTFHYNGPGPEGKPPEPKTQHFLATHDATISEMLLQYVYYVTICFKVPMNTSDTASPHICTRSLKLLGDYWTLNIIGALSRGELRYCDLQRAAGGVNPVTLGNRLHKLQNAGLIIRIASADNISVSYRLTELGNAALPILTAVDNFSRKLPDNG